MSVLFMEPSDIRLNIDTFNRLFDLHHSRLNLKTAKMSTENNPAKNVSAIRDGDRVTLNMSRDTAEALLCVSRRVGGTADRSPRGLIDGIDQALTTVLPSNERKGFDKLSSGGVSFKDTAVPRVVVLHCKADNSISRVTFKCVNGTLYFINIFRSDWAVDMPKHDDPRWRVLQCGLMDYTVFASPAGSLRIIADLIDSPLDG